MDMRILQPDNVLLSADRTQVKLCDFGVSEMFTAGDDRMKKSGGSPAFMSPEAAIRTCPGAKESDTFKADVSV
jgi:serine/threonine protein kinase